MPRINISIEDHERILAQSRITGTTPGAIIHQALGALEEHDAEQRWREELAGFDRLRHGVMLLLRDIHNVQFDDSPEDDELTEIVQTLRRRQTQRSSAFVAHRPDPREHDDHDDAERQAISTEPMSVWTRLRHPLSSREGV